MSRRFRHAQEEKPQRGDLGDDRPDRQLPLFEQIDLVRRSASGPLGRVDRRFVGETTSTIRR
jgi:hypothetical protein